MTRSLPKVLAAVEDPGAANCIVPVVERLVADGRTAPVVIGLAAARDVLRRGGIAFKEPRHGARSAEAAVRVFEAEAPAVVLVGTSEAPDSLDRRLTLKARAQGIPVVSVLDHWSNYSRRYSGPAPHERLRFLPDVICVMDERARAEMIAEGFPPEVLFVSGQPHLERYAAQRAPSVAEARAAFRAERGLTDADRLIVFASETFGWTADESYRFPLLSGARERTIVVLEHVLGALTEFARTESVKVVMVNKLHPKNDIEEFAWLATPPLPFTVESIREVDPRVLVCAADLVVGMTSMLLLEASAAGVPTLPVIPRECEERMLGGWADPEAIARDPVELRTRLRALLVDHAGAHASRVPRYEGAAARVTGKIYEMVGGEARR